MFKNIGITGKKQQTNITKTIECLIQVLLEKDCSLFIDHEFSNLLTNSYVNVSYCKKNKMGYKCDLIVVIGGDGSILGAARDLVTSNTPLIGVNLGKLGFLADITPNEIEYHFDHLFSGDYDIEYRFLLQADIVRENEIINCCDALNDIVLHPSRSTKMIEFELRINGEFVYRQHADGLIISTPTGSTAYALSAGGPIVHPEMDAIILVPMYPHRLTNRPLVVGGDSEIILKVNSSNQNEPMLCSDGQVEIDLMSQDEIVINKKEKTLQLLHPQQHSFYENCRSKLHWQSQQ